MLKTKILTCISLSIFSATISLASESATQIQPVMERFTQHLANSVSYVWGADPFLKTPGFAPNKETPSKYTLQAVIYSDTERSAIVDEREVFVGSMIDSYRVSEIGRNYVILDNGTSLKEINMPSNPVTSYADVKAFSEIVRSPTSKDQSEEGNEVPENEK